MELEKVYKQQAIFINSRYMYQITRDEDLSHGESWTLYEGQVKGIQENSSFIFIFMIYLDLPVF